MPETQSHKIYLIAGEASGDLHGSNLMEALKRQSPDTSFRFWGGDRMAALGGKPVKHIKELAFMGFTEVLMNLSTILGNIKFCKSDIETFNPDVLILIDYPGFNLRIAEWAKKKGIKVYYYISPQVWAWKESRVKKIKRVVDRMFVILPFEQDFYKKHGMEVEFHGHPLLDEVERFKSFDSSEIRKELGLPDQPIIGLLPGSRKQEISIKLPVMLQVAKKFPHYQFVIAGAPAQDPSFYDSFTQQDNVTIVFNATYKLLKVCHAALVTSGTATLETGLFRVPQVVCYKGGTISYHIAKRLIKVKYISLVNLIMDREVIPELIQHDMTSSKVSEKLERLLEGDDRQKMLKEYDALIEKLGGPGASEKIAKAMLKTL